MKKFFNYTKNHIFVDTMICVALAIIISLILNLFGLMFREWVKILFIIVTMLATIIGLFQLIFKIKKQTVKESLTVIFIISLTVLISLAYPIFAFTYLPEHVIEKDGQKMVAYVDGFFRTYVYYYDYKNAFLVGNTKKIEEDYGDGGFDPIENKYGNTYTPKRTTYYNNKGKIIKTK